MNEFQPQPVYDVEDVQQLKAFTDPLRSRILVVLAERAATNQQLATLLAEPQAKVLHHLRFLFDVGLIRLVETRIKGGNVEKYYRAIARAFQLHGYHELRPQIVSTEFTVVQQEVAASARTWPDTPPQYVYTSRRLSPQAAQRFYDDLRTFVDSYWDNANNGPANEHEALPMYYCAAVVFRGTPPTDGSSEDV